MSTPHPLIFWDKRKMSVLMVHIALESEKNPHIIKTVCKGRCALALYNNCLIFLNACKWFSLMLVCRPDSLHLQGWPDPTLTSVFPTH